MKKNKNLMWQDFEKLAQKINRYIRTGKWDELNVSFKQQLIARLNNLFQRLKAFFSLTTLNRALGAAVFLISGHVSAQTFAPQVANPFGIESDGAYIHQPTFIDLDGDGDLDLLTNDYYTTSFLYQENIGDATNPEFGPQQVNPFGLLPSYYVYMPKAADIDGDGDLDIFSTGDYGVTTFYENIGTATEPEFTDEVISPFGLEDNFNFIFDVVDMDNDGDYDLVMGNINIYSYSFSVKYYENTGTAEAPSFETDGVEDAFGLTPTPLTYLISFGDFADLDGDGDFDLMRVDYYGDVVYYHENTGTAEEAEFAPGNGEGMPFDIVLDLPYAYLSGVAMVDIDGDSDIDVFLTEYYGGTYFYENKTINASIRENNNTIQLNLFPNPAATVINIDAEIDMNLIQTIQIRALDGSVVHSVNSNETSIDITGLSTGTYFLELVTTDQTIIHEKFMKN